MSDQDAVDPFYPLITTTPSLLDVSRSPASHPVANRFDHAVNLLAVHPSFLELFSSFAQAL